jgi:hypothetical protein
VPNCSVKVPYTGGDVKALWRTSWSIEGHIPPAVGQPPRAGLSQGVLDENVLLLSCKGSINHCPVSTLDEVPATIRKEEFPKDIIQAM